MPHVARVRSSALSSSSAGSGLLQLVQSVVRQLMKVIIIKFINNR